MADKYAKLRLLLGQQRTAARELADWQRIQLVPNEQWRNPVVVAGKVAESERQLQAVEAEIDNEMAARLGIPSGHLVLKAWSSPTIQKGEIS